MPKDRVIGEESTWGPKTSVCAPSTRCLNLWQYLTNGAAIIVVVTATAYRLGAVSSAHHPGHADAAFYFSVGRNLNAGRGPVIDYVWHFLVQHTELTHYSFDYWMPLPSYLIAAMLKLTGGGIESALALTVLLSVLLAVATYILARELTDTWWTPPAAVVLVVTQPSVSRFTVETEAAIFLGASGVTALALCVLAQHRPPVWAAAGFFVGLSHLARNDGLLLLTASLLAAIAWGASSRVGWKPVAGLVLGYFIVMGPFMLMSVSNTGAPLPQAAASFPFIYEYEDLYSAELDRSIGALLGGDLRNFLSLRASAVDQHLSTSLSLLSPVGAFLVSAAIGARLVCKTRVGPRGVSRAQLGVDSWSLRLLEVCRHRWFVPVTFAMLVLAFDVLVAPVVASAGAWYKASVVIFPIVIVAALDGLTRWEAHWKWKFAWVAVVAVTWSMSVASITRNTIARNNAIGDASASLAPVLSAEQQCLDREVIVMTRSPWELTEATGFRSVQIPNGPISVILRMVDRYNVTHVRPSANRAALTDMGALSDEDGPFEKIEGASLFRVKSEDYPRSC